MTQVLLGPGGHPFPLWSPFSLVVTICPLCYSPPTCPSRVLTMLLLVPGVILSSAPRSSSSSAPSQGWWGALGCSGVPRAGLPAQGVPLWQRQSALGGLTPTRSNSPNSLGCRGVHQVGYKQRIGEGSGDKRVLGRTRVPHVCHPVQRPRNRRAPRCHRLSPAEAPVPPPRVFLAVTCVTSAATAAGAGGGGC